jgi:two-component system response regulator
VVKILLVEDNPQDVELMQRALEAELDCRVRVALTRASFETELENEPDIIVSDSNVLAFDGMTALKVATEKRPDIPFVFCTGHVTEEKKEVAIQLGAAGWVSKDDCFSHLVCVVKRLSAFEYSFDFGNVSTRRPEWEPPRRERYGSNSIR